MIKKFRPYILALAVIATVAGIVYAIQDPSFQLRQPQLSLGLKTLFNAVTISLYCMVLVLSVISGRSKFLSSAQKGLKLLIWMLIIYIGCTLVTKYVKTSQPLLIVGITAGVAAVAFLWRYFSHRKISSDLTSSTSIRRSATGSGQIKYAWAMLHGALLVSVIVTVLFFFLTLKSADNYFILAPLAATVLCLLLWRVFRWRGWLLLAALSVLSEAVIFLYGTYVAYKFGSFATVVAFSLLYLAVIVPLCDLYCRKEQSI